MSKDTDQTNDNLDHAVEVSIRLALLGFLVYACYLILSPFINLIVWAAILAIAVHPLFVRLVPVVRNKKGLTATAMVTATLMILIVPVYEMTVSFVETMQALNARFEAGTLRIPPPNDSVSTWPIIGEQLHEIWTLASDNLESMLSRYQDELASVSQGAIGVVAGLGGAVGSFILSTMIAGVFLSYANECYAYCVKVLDRLMNKNGRHFADLGTQTVRSVAQGVIGIAFLQALMSAGGLIAMDIPAVGVWVLLILVLAVIQLSPIIVLGPIAIYAFTVNDPLPSIVFAIYCALIGSSDAILKPLILGRGMAMPMPVILFGAIGGLLLMGILGLFIGAIVLAIGYTLFNDWVNGSMDLIETQNENGSAESEIDSKPGA
jgi:predicted PurR-regulated permease PerM